METHNSKTDSFDRALKEAINVEVPSSLTQRILQRQQAYKKRRRRRWDTLWVGFSPQWRMAYAMAASVVIVIALYLVTPWLSPGTVSLQRQVIAYLQKEHEALNQPRDVPDSELAGMFRDIGANITGDLGRVQYCEITKINDRKSATMVVPGTKGPIAVVFIMGEFVADRTPMGNGGLKGFIMPAVKGSVAIVGTPGEELSEIEKKIQQSITWL